MSAVTPGHAQQPYTHTRAPTGAGTGTDDPTPARRRRPMPRRAAVTGESQRGTSCAKGRTSDARAARPGSDGQSTSFDLVPPATRPQCVIFHSGRACRNTSRPTARRRFVAFDHASRRVVLRPQLADEPEVGTVANSDEPRGRLLGPLRSSRTCSPARSDVWVVCDGHTILAVGLYVC